MKVSWTASVTEGCTVRGYQLTGTGNLPAMTLTNEGSKTDLVTYHVSVELDGVAMYTYIPQFGITECLIQYKCSVNTPPPHSIRSG